MKVGILTFHEADSYGAVLQAHALQHTLSVLGADSEFVQINAPQGAESAQPSAAQSLFARRMQAAGQKRAALFAAFRKERLEISAPYAPTDPIAENYDLFVAGSDQIWNFRIPGADARYFLPFARPEQRCSYAASFGADALPEKAEVWAAAQLAGFRAISVREESGCQLVKKLTGRDAVVCLDPTLLPDRAHWRELAAPLPAEDYVLLFLLKYDEALVEKAQAEAQELGLPLRVVTASFVPQLGMEAWNGTGVTEWLDAIRGARCVFTNSFHGMVFSMIFERRFQVQRLGGELSSRNGRIEELLAYLELSDALDHPVQPEYERVWAKMEQRRAASLNYLKGLVCDDSAV
ncbi:MAG: polysaccharide pyruvyl transferase family protein [Ruminococcaceae bacterium]|nr:polysaccharide pyruvyl transferase family protein [Oscillospiraceae bacterium]